MTRILKYYFPTSREDRFLETQWVGFRLLGRVRSSKVLEGGRPRRSVSPPDVFMHYDLSNRSFLLFLHQSVLICDLDIFISM